jgi:hypothetical protein
MFNLGDMLGVKIDGEKVNELIKFMLNTAVSIDESLKKLVELKKEEVKILTKGGKNASNS